MLAERLTRRGLTLSAGALATAISESTVSACMPPGLIGAAVKGAKLAAAGNLAAISTSITILMKAGAKAMFLAKLKATVATLMVVAVLGGGLAYSGSGGSQAAKPQNELEALRRENELLRVNLRVTLEKIESLEKQVNVKGDAAKRLYAADVTAAQRLLAEALDSTQRHRVRADDAERIAEAQARKAEDAVAAAHAALDQKKRADEAARAALGKQKAAQPQQLHQYRWAVRALQDLQGNENSKNARQKALDALEKAIKELRELEQKSKN
jgi:hypothetical protein